ncbi:CD209 antigen-like protein A isoform X2 [Polyodon spathula]|uniref:CD209 antigen-like protein A isoform X2 n=1 Tax=Polyodon spathula TaxID=7913 RepID=UPI001B7F5E2A|nr:CD209 antigen-like protein A isoform X2 [Polyodon spathula]
MEDEVYENFQFYQQTGQKKHQDRKRNRAKAKTAVAVEEENIYMIMEESIEMEEKKQNPEAKCKADLKPQKSGDHNVCGSKSIVFLYALLIASSGMWVALLSLVFVKYSEMSAEIQDLTSLNKNDSQHSSNVRNLEKDISDLKTKESQLSTGVGNLDTQISSLKSKVCYTRTCPCDWKEFSGKCYYFSKSEEAWQKAKEFCYSQDAVLVVIKTEQELNFIGGQVSRGHYVGLSDLQTEGTWVWLDGSTVDSRFWRSGEPNNANEEDCGELIEGKLNDISCSTTLRWICEK